MRLENTRLIKKMRRTFAAAAAMFLFLSVPVLLLNLWVFFKAVPYMRDLSSCESSDCILVLGCGLTADGRPGQHLRRRMDRAIALYQNGAAPKMIVSGDHGRDNYDEVNAMKRYAVEHGVPSEAVFMDHAGFSTYESMVRADKVFGCKHIIVVTQPFHIARSIYDAQMQGITALGVSADDAEGYSFRYRLYLQIREVMARCKDVFYCLRRVPVVTQGMRFDLSGSGAVTDDEHTRIWMNELNLTDGT